VVAAHLDDCLEALRVARQSTTAAQEDASEDTIGWLALTLVGYFRWFYFEKLRALDLCELLLRSGQAATLDECAALLTKRAIALQRWLASTTPRAPDDVATSHPSAGTLSVSLQGQPHAGWRGMADSLREALGQAVEPGIAVTLDKTLADPHRLRLWFTRPLRDLAKHDDPLAWLAEGCGPLDQARAPQRKTPTPRP
jgi:hypothetical protein